jgi:5-methylcytosine-specific restriction enzyme subunit McrC
MEAVFESFVAQTLPDEVPPHLKVKSQAATYSLVKHGPNDCFKLRPDLLIQSRQPVQTKMVMDTKWKMVNSSQQKNHYMGWHNPTFIKCLPTAKNTLAEQAKCI